MASVNRRGPVWTAPALLSGLLTLPFLGRASLWSDEIDSISAALRSLPQTRKLLAHQDAPLGAYYLMLHLWVTVGGTSAVWVRLPSAAAVVLAVALTAVLGERLHGRSVGIGAGLLLGANAFVLGYGLDARPYAFAASFAVAATLLVSSPRPLSARRQVVYVGLLSAGTLAHLFFVLLVPAHALGLYFEGRPLRPWVRPWAAALLLTSPLLLLGARQTGEVGYLTAPTPLRWAASLPTLAGGVSWTALPVLGLAFVAWRARRPGCGTSLLLAWAVVPAGLLLTVSVWRPLYLSRYVIESAPAIALLAASGARALFLRAASPTARCAMAAALTLLLAVAVLTSLSRQGAAYRYEDPRAAANYVLAKAHAGDGIVYVPISARTAVDWYLRGGRIEPPRPHDVLLDPRHVEQQQGNFGGREVSAEAARRQILASSAVWLVAYGDGSGRDRPTARLALTTLQHCFSPRATRRFGLLTVSLFTHPPKGLWLRPSCR